jgi:hypothetical protein
MADDELTPEEQHAAADAEGRMRLVRTDFLERASSIDASVRNLLDELDLTRTDEEHDRMLDAIMGASRAADALRAFAREDLDAAIEATTSMGYYARKALGEAA